MNHDASEVPADESAPIRSETPPRSPSPAPPSRRLDGWRAALAWTLGLVAIVGMSALAVWAGVVLSVFGLAPIVLVLGVALLGSAAIAARRLALPAATVALALMLPAAGVQLIETRIDPSFGTLIAAPRTAADVAPGGYTRGYGPVLVDLRQFEAAPGSTTRIAARSDDDRVVVALPRDRCFDLDVRYSVGDEYYSDTRTIARRAAAVVGATDPDDGWLGFAPRGISETERQTLRELEADARNPKLPSPDRRYLPSNLLLFGTFPHTSGSAVRRSAAEHAPKLVLDLQAGKQVVVRDYPEWAGPLATDEHGYGDQVSGTDWPARVRAPLSPGERDWRLRSTVRTKLNRSRWVKWEREILPFAKQQAKRLAGACATDAELARRAYRFYTQPERYLDDQGKVHRLIGGPTTRHSEIEQPVASTPRLVFAVEVDGLGRTRVVDQLPTAAITLEPVFESRTR